MPHSKNALTIKYEKMRFVGEGEYGVIIIIMIIIIKEIKFRKEGGDVKYLSYMFGENALILITKERVWNNENKRKQIKEGKERLNTFHTHTCVRKEGRERLNTFLC